VFEALMRKQENLEDLVRDSERLKEIL
jgi:hypothetical protein